MPVDTNLTVEPPEQSGGFLANPLGLVSGIMGIRGQAIQQQNEQLQGGILQQNLDVLQRQVAARAKYGQIMAHASTLEAGNQAALADPDVAPFAGEWIAQNRAGLASLQEYENAAQTGATSGLQVIAKAAGAAAS